MNFNYKKIFAILFRSIRKGFDLKWWKFLGVGSVGSIFGLLNTGRSMANIDVNKSFYYGVTAFLILYIVRVLLLFIVDSLKYFHQVYINSTYGEAIILLKESFAELHQYRKTPGHQDEHFMISMVNLCNNLKTIYDRITKSDCSVSIKVPLNDLKVDEKTILLNLTRDTAHCKKDTTLNRDTEKYKNAKHTLIGNTAFANSFNTIIKNEKQKSYINNNIGNTENYNNTSQDCYEKGILPYKSELVYPIVPSKLEKAHNYDCHGFICVDSNNINAFMSKYDIAIIEGVADGIYDVISDRNKFKNQKDGLSKN